MESTAADFENSALFVALILLAFPVLFAAIWTGVLGITSRMSGWHRLAKHYRYKDEPILSWMHRGGGGVHCDALPFAGMRGRLGVGVATTGIMIKPPTIIRPFHPALFLPFSKIHSEAERSFLKLNFTTLRMTDVPDVQIHILKSARTMAENVRLKSGT